MAVPHGPGTHQNLTVVAVVPLIIDRHDDPAETHTDHKTQCSRQQVCGKMV